MILFHGSNVAIESVDLSKASRYKDFGKAFYLSSEYGQAAKMAEFRVKIIKSGSPIVTSFQFDDAMMQEGSALNVKVFPHYSLEWAEFVWNNRNDQQDYHHPYDIVYGPIANDTVGFQMRMYRINGGDLDVFLKGLKYSKGETFQYAFCTEKAIKYLKKVEL